MFGTVSNTDQNEEESEEDKVPRGKLTCGEVLRGDDHSRVRILGPGREHDGEAFLGGHRGSGVRLLGL